MVRNWFGCEKSIFLATNRKIYNTKVIAKLDSFIRQDSSIWGVRNGSHSAFYTSLKNVISDVVVECSMLTQELQ